MDSPATPARLPRQHLTAERLSIGYGKTVVAGPLDLVIHSGSLICLLGPNGAGKSTLLRTLAGLQVPRSGKLNIGNGTAPFAASFLAQHVAVVLSEFDGIGGLKVAELVELGRAPHAPWSGKLSARDRSVVTEAMTSTDILALASRRVGSLSDGERQRVMIARALAQETPLILLDEPTSHLDIAHRLQVMRLLYRLSRTHQKGILLSSHDLDLALQASDELWILSDEGEFTAGCPEDLALMDRLAGAYGIGGEAYDWRKGGLHLLEETGPAIQLQGPEELLRWARQLIRKAGWREDPSAGEPSPWRLVAMDRDRWALTLGEIPVICSSLAEVGRHLVTTRDARVTDG